MDSTVLMNLSWMVGSLLMLLFIGMPIGFALYGVAFFSLMFLGGGMHDMLGALLYNSTGSYALVALPLFIFMGEILIRSGTSVPLFRGASFLFRNIPGGMVHANIISCSIFSACSGSSTATTLAIGSVSYPELEKAGYDKKIILGSIAAGGSLGILIPPSIMMIIFGSLTTTSVGKLFIGGIIPGIMMALLFCLWIALASVIFPHWFPEKDNRVIPLFKQISLTARDLWPVSLLVFLLMGTIYGGFATPTEAAAMGIMFAMAIVHLVYKKLTWKVLIEALKSTMFLTTLMMICVVGARALGMGLSMLEIPDALSDFVMTLDVNRYVIWAGIVVLYMMLGCLVDGFDLMLITTPVFYPIVVNTLGFDPLWFGVVLVVILEISLLTPPVGINLFVTHSIGRGGNLIDTIIGILPFLAVQLLCIILLTAFPMIITWLPSFV